SNNQGIGRLLIDAMVARAKELGAKTVDLTSRPSREAANRLYLRLGFVERETNVYRFDL
ncbi:MAG: GNAT family N-acetyltransferase, partial [Acidimicrobiales bacterium]